MNTTKLNALATQLYDKAETLRQIEYRLQGWEVEIETLQFEEKDTDYAEVELDIEKTYKKVTEEQIKTIIKKLNELT